MKLSLRLNYDAACFKWWKGFFWFRPLPPLPDLEISDQSVVKAADEIQVWVNHALSIARDIAMGRNLSRFLQVGCWSFSEFFPVRYHIFFMLINRENNLKRFFLMRGFDRQVAFLLWVVSYVGSVFNFLTLVYVGEFSTNFIIMFS